jgi:hypothetical protein
MAGKAANGQHRIRYIGVLLANWRALLYIAAACSNESISNDVVNEIDSCQLKKRTAHIFLTPYQTRMHYHAP